MNQFKQIIGSLPRHVSSNPVTSSGCPPGKDSLLRSGRRYLRTTNPPRNTQSASFATEDAGCCHQMGGDSSQALMYGKSKLVLFHNRNSPMDKSGNLDIPLFQPNVSCTVSRINKKTVKTEASKGEKTQPTKVTSSNTAVPSVVPEQRTYAKMIAEYSEALEKEKRASAKSKDSLRGIFSRLPLNSVVSSLTKMERPKISKSKASSSNSLSVISTKPGKDVTHALTEKSVKNASRKASPSVMKDAQKRDYFTKNRQKSPRLDENKDWMNTIAATTEKQSRLEKSKNRLTLARTHHSDFDFLCCNTDIHNDKEPFVSAEWLKPKLASRKSETVNISVDNSASPKMKAVQKFNILAGEDKIEIQIPINTEEKPRNVAGSSSSLPKYAMSLNKTSSTSMKAASAADAAGKGDNTSKSNDGCKNPLLSKKTQSNNKIKPLKKEGPLPWWASAGCTKPSAECLHDIYTSEPIIEVLASEEISPVNVPLEEQPKVVKVPITEPQKLSAGPKSVRRKRKMTSISKVKKHIEEELEEKKREAKKTTQKEAVPKPKPDEAAEAAKKEKSAAKIEKKTSVVESKDKKDTKDGNKKEEIAKVDESKKSGESKNDDKKAKSAKSVDKNAAPEIKNRPVVAEVKPASKDGKEPSKPSIGVLQRSIQELNKKGDKQPAGPEQSDMPIIPETVHKRKKDNLIDYGYKVKRVTDAIIPIEKRKDGTLIDYGLKVPTRKPRKKPPLTEPSKTSVQDNAPKKTISAPQQQLKNEHQRKSSIPLKIGNDASKPSPTAGPKEQRVAQSKSELPLRKTPVQPATDRSAAAERSRSKAAIREKAGENLAFESNKNRGKPSGSGGGPVRKSGSSSTAIEGKNNKNEGNSSSANSRGDSTSLRTFRSVQTINNRSALMLRTRFLPMVIVEKNQSKVNVVSAESKTSLGSERPEKQLIYSVWLNRFHTRKHETLIM